MKTFLRASLVSALALGIYPTLDSAGPRFVLSLSSSADAQTTDPYPNLYLFDDAEPGQYVVTFASGAYAPPSDASGPPTGPTTSLAATEDADEVFDDLCDDYGATKVDVYAFVGGFSCTMDLATAQAMSQDSRIASVESDAHVYSCGKTGITKSPGLSNPSAGWGLDRIDQRNLPLNGQYLGNQTGAGVDVWSLDTGVWPGDTDFWTDPNNPASTRVVLNFPNAKETIPKFTDITRTINGKNPLYTSADDDVDHGTAVMSVAAGNKCGVAPGVTIHAVKVLRSLGWGSDSDAGDISWTIAGVNWILNNHLTKGRRAVLNMSLYHDQRSKNDPAGVKNKQSIALRSAIDKLLKKNVVVVVGAGNLGQDAGNFTPSQITEVITVGATQISDQTVGSTSAFDSIADYKSTQHDNNSPGSNYGNVVDLFAPGNFISISTLTGTDMNHRTTFFGSGAYGTSFSAPYVTGVVAQYLAVNPTATPAQVQTWLTTNATKTSSSLGNSLPAGTQNCFLYTNL